MKKQFEEFDLLEELRKFTIHEKDSCYQNGGVECKCALDKSYYKLKNWLIKNHNKGKN